MVLTVGVIAPSNRGMIARTIASHGAVAGRGARPAGRRVGRHDPLLPEAPPAAAARARGPRRLVRARAPRAAGPHPRAPGAGPLARADRAAARRRARRHRRAARGRGRAAADAEAREEFLTLARARRALGRPAAAARSGRARGPARPARPRRRRALHDRRRRDRAPGLRLLERGFPLPELLALAREHTTATRDIAEHAVALFDEHVRATAARRPTSPTTRRPSGSSTRSARCSRRSPRSSRTTSAACCSRSRRSTSSRSARTPSSRRSPPRPSRRLEQGILVVKADAGRASSRRRPTSARAVEEMFDRIAPRYDRSNRMLTLRMDVGWRPHRGRARSASHRARSCSTSRAAPATSAATSPRAGHCADRRRLLRRHARAAHADAPLVRADALRAAVPDRSRRRHRLRLRARATSSRSRRSSPSARACCGPAAASRCSTSPNRRRRWCARGHGVWFRHVVPFVGGLVSDARAYATSPRRPRTSRRRPSSRWSVARAGFADVSSTARSGSAPRSCSPGRAHDAPVSPARVPQFVAHTEPIADPGDLLDAPRPRRLRVARRRHRLRHRRRRRRVRRCTVRAAALAALRARPPTTTRRRAPGPRAVGALPFDGAGELRHPGAHRRAATPTAAPGARRSKAPTIPPALHVTAPRRRGSRCGRRIERRRVARRGRARARRDRRGRAREGRARPRGRRRGRRAVRRRRGARHPARDAARLHRLRDRRLRRREPRAARAPAPARASSPARWPAPASTRAALLALARRTRASTASSSTRSSTRSRPCATRVACDGPAAVRFADGHAPRHADPRPPRRPPTSARSTSSRRCTPRPRSAARPREPARRRSARSKVRPRPLRRPVRLGRRRAATASSSSRSAARRSTARTPGCFAGAGIVAGSEPDAEWAETQAKLEPMLRALVRP